MGWSAGASLSHVLGPRFARVVGARHTRASLELTSSGGGVTRLDAGGLQPTADLTAGS